jgi:rhamnosyltransferase subunit B
VSHVLLLPFGTAGSVYPFVALGRMLRARGHRVTMIAANAYAPAAGLAGLDFAGIGDRELDGMLADPRLWTWRDAARVAYASAARSANDYVDAVDRIVAADGMPDLMLAPMVNFGARIAREKHGIPLVTVHLHPLMFVNATALPLLSPAARVLRMLPRWLRKALLKAPNPSDRFALRDVRACCIAHGVDPPLSLWRQWWHSPDGVLALFPQWFAPSLPDWPHNLLQWDFPLEDLAAEQPLEPQLLRFLEAGPKPVVFTAGTGQYHAASFFATATKIVERSGCRAVFVTRKPEQLPPRLPDTIHWAGYAPFSRLLPHARAVVHHGGIGTVAQAFAAGVPQLVVAMSLDQPDNAERVERLGAGVAMQASRFTADAALPLLERCLHDGALHAAARDCAARMRPRPPAEPLVTWLESREVPSRRHRVDSPPAGRDPPVFLVPGLGSDSRTFRGPWAEIPGAVFVEWPDYGGEMSIEAVARFVADAWRIPDGAVVVASSFGGVIALEIARTRKLRAVVLIASSPDPHDFDGVRAMRRFARVAPVTAIQRVLRAREGIRRERYGRDPTPFRRALLDAIEQFSVTSVPFYVRMLDAVDRWPGYAGAGTRIVRIHGRQDRKVRVPANADLLLDGGHLIVMSHARECVDFIAAALRDLRTAT